MSRIPVPSRHYHPDDRPESPSPSPSPTPLQASQSSNLPSRPLSTSTPIKDMSSISGYRNSPLSSEATDTRKRQSKRDEAPQAHPAPAAAGTVSALRPLPALTVPQSISVADASQLCAAKRTDCVLVVDDEEHLAGIFTAKDLAFRVVSAGLDARNTPVSAIMTRSPMVTRDTTSATEALNTMVTRGFRHLPVCNEDGDVVGLLDIAKVFYEALEKLERAHGSSQKLYNALEGVQSEWGGSAGPQQAMLQYIEALRTKMSIPDIASILDSRTLPCCVGVRTTVREAARLMKEHHTTAVCVMESSGGPGTGQIGSGGAVTGKIAGIFTSKDVVLRVIAAGLDPKTCSVVRVMTPHPDTAPPSLTIQEALRKMHDGRYLNLPVVDTDARLVGVVDVLKLTYATLEQINSMNDEASSDGSAGGPMWNRFWNSFGQTTSNHGDDESAVSGSVRQSESQFDIPGTPSKSGFVGDLSSDLHPNDSASAVGMPLNGDDGGSVVGQQVAAAVETDDGTYLFKFVTPSGRTHRFQARYDSYETIREIVCIKLGGDPFFDPATASTVATTASADGTAAEDGGQANGVAASSSIETPDPNDFQLAYTDDEDDVVLITADGDVQDAVKVARKQGRDRVVLLLQGGRGWEEAAARASASATAANGSAQSLQSSGAANKRRQREAAEAQLQSVQEEEEKELGEEAEATPVKRKSKKGAKGGDDDELLFGVLPKELALPAAIGFLGVAVLAAVVVTRGGGNSR
ncbi:related to CBS and PB1 domain protein [Pseudozyma flocculosa]|uniref:Related to CBS and PB1 domain protein n=1 Tax=Pseudozyma flocculosa TaxID=84751 RepID=A0A5C3F7S8_9BASI|nr:related to CBS and PB1 domain protein [Pseudozyma flocculosa]